MTILSRLGVFARSSVLVAAAAFTAPVTLADPQTADRGLEVAKWSRDVWQSALEHRGENALDLLLRAPKGNEDLGMGELYKELDRYRANAAQNETARLNRIAEVKKNLVEADEKGDLLDGFRAAIEYFTLATDHQTVLDDPMVKKLEATALEKAKKDEAAGKWLDSHGLYNRLHLLHEIEGTYKPDLKRLSTRLLMLRNYVPVRLHEMRNQQRVAEGEEPLPPFNTVGEEWQSKLAGIDERMVLTAINAAASSHVERIPVSSILVGALNNVRTMATTSDLKLAFLGLGDDEKQKLFVEHIDGAIATIKAAPEKVDFYGVMRALRDLQKSNAETVGIANEALLHEFGNGAMSTLDDYSEIIWPDELAQFSRTTTGEFPGVGIQITLDDGLQLKVVTPLEGTPAARAGIRPGDVIRKIDGKDTTGIALQQAVDRITGPAGTKVTLSVDRDGIDGTLDFELVRAKIPVHSVKGWKRTGPGEMDWDWFIDPTHKVGYVRITNFTKDTSADLVGAVRQMMKTGLGGLIIDLRYNPGGLLDEAVSVCNLFVDQGVIVSQQDKNGKQSDAQVAKPGQAILADLPVTVLVNEGSASASEIVSGCLQDYKKAVLVGDRSFGKGSVQNVFPIQDKAAFKLTTFYYKLPNGRLVHRRDGSKDWGVNPDVKVDVLPEQIEKGLILRQDADVYQVDEAGKAIPQMVRQPKPRKNKTGKVEPDRTPVGPADPDRLLAENMDPQLEAALLLVQTRAVADQATRTAAAGK